MVSSRWPRREDESDDAYFMRVLYAAKSEWPDMTLTQLYFGTCDETGLPCVHPFNLREYHGGLGTTTLGCFLDSERPDMMRNPEYRERVLSRTRCPVCDTWAPRDPVDIRRQREERLLMLLLAVGEGTEKEILTSSSGSS